MTGKITCVECVDELLFVGDENGAFSFNNIW